jgi:hypothetical protein
MDAEEGVYDGLMKILAGIDERRRERFFFYDLDDPARLVYHYERT